MEDLIMEESQMSPHQGFGEVGKAGVDITSKTGQPDQTVEPTTQENKTGMIINKIISNLPNQLNKTLKTGIKTTSGLQDSTKLKGKLLKFTGKKVGAYVQYAKSSLTQKMPGTKAAITSPEERLEERVSRNTMRSAQAKLDSVKEKYEQSAKTPEDKNKLEVATENFLKKTLGTNINLMNNLNPLDVSGDKLELRFSQIMGDVAKARTEYQGGIQEKSPMEKVLDGLKVTVENKDSESETKIAAALYLTFYESNMSSDDMNSLVDSLKKALS